MSVYVLISFFAYVLMFLCSYILMFLCSYILFWILMFSCLHMFFRIFVFLISMWSFRSIRKYEHIRTIDKNRKGIKHTHAKTHKKHRNHKTHKNAKAAACTFLFIWKPPSSATSMDLSWAGAILHHSDAWPNYLEASLQRNKFGSFISKCNPAA